MHSFILSVFALCGAFALASCDNSTTGFYTTPELTRFIQLELIVNLPENTTSPSGISAYAQNGGGNVTGAIEATILPVGAGFERVVVNAWGEHSVRNSQQGNSELFCHSALSYTSVLRKPPQLRYCGE